MELYRVVSIGSALSDALDELIQSQQLTQELAEKIKMQFDRSLNKVMSTKLKNKASFKAHCKTFNQFEHVHKYRFDKVTVSLDKETKLEADGMKLVACDAKVVPDP
eukprot:m.91611 g.91611  ORF g.91611 m.91611 type:complete len:106 (-) comp16501_c0_seq2:322-639(-)